MINRHEPELHGSDDVTLTALNDVTAIVNTAGDLAVFAGADALVSLTTAHSASIGALGDVTVDGAVTNDLEVFAAGDATLTSVTVGHDLAAGAYGTLTGSAIVNHDISYLWARGDITGDFEAGNRIALVSSYSEIDVNLIADFISAVRSYGQMTGLFTVSDEIGSLRSGDEITVIITSPLPANIVEHDHTVNSDWPADIDYSLESVAAALRDFVRNLELADRSLAADRIPLADVIAAIRVGTERGIPLVTVTVDEIDGLFELLINQANYDFAVQQAADTSWGEANQIAIRTIDSTLTAIKDRSDGRFEIRNAELALAATAYKTEMTSNILAREDLATAKIAGKVQSKTAADKYFAAKAAGYPDLFPSRVRTIVLDRVQFYADVVGAVAEFIPIVGKPFAILGDAISLGISVMRGKSRLEIGIGILAFIPAGDIAKGAFKIGNKLLRSSDDIAGILAAGARRGDWCAIGLAAKRAGLPPAIVKNLPNCFIAGTQVWMLAGEPWEATAESQVLADTGSDEPSNPLHAAATLACVGFIIGMVVDHKRKRRNEEELIDDLFLDDDWLGNSENQEDQEDNLESSESYQLCDHEVDNYWRQDESSNNDRNESSLAVLTAPKASPTIVNQVRTLSEQRVTTTPSKPSWFESVKSSSATFVLTLLFAVLGLALFGGSPPKAIAPFATSASMDERREPRLISANIEDIKQVDYVLAKEPITGEIAERKVLQAFSRVSDHLRLLTLRSDLGDEQTISTTDEHPFFVEGNHECKASELRIGDKIVQDDGGYTILTSSQREEHPKGIAVYNFEVEGFHSYFVSAQGSRAPPVWVHNAKCNEKPFIRYASELEATRSKAVNGLHVDPSLNGKFKNVGGVGEVDPAKLGKKNKTDFSHKITIELRDGAREWLRKKRVIIPEGHNPDTWKIPVELVDEFNDLFVKSIKVTPR